MEDEIHAVLYCPRYIALRRGLMRDLAREQEEDMGLKTFLVGLSDVSMEDDDHVDEQGLDYANDGTR